MIELQYIIYAGLYIKIELSVAGSASCISGPSAVETTKFPVGVGTRRLECNFRTRTSAMQMAVPLSNGFGTLLLLIRTNELAARIDFVTELSNSSPWHPTRRTVGRIAARADQQKRIVDTACDREDTSLVLTTRTSELKATYRRRKKDTQRRSATAVRSEHSSHVGPP